VEERFDLESPHRNKSLLAKTDPVYLGYDIERYIKMDWKARYMPGK
jgi:arginyl-tRNA--protein-N-Asp/Glu arginylyltransferase